MSARARGVHAAAQPKFCLRLPPILGLSIINCSLVLILFTLKSKIT
jgi:hypothetical protein